MGNKEMEPGTDEIQAAYSVILYKASQIPEGYKSMIFSKWLRSLRFGNDYFKLIDSSAYYSSYHKYIELILSKPNCLARFAVLSDDHDVVLGFSLSEGPALHYVHVHRDHRGKGIGTALVPKAIEVITHITKTGMSIWNAKMPHVKFNPFFN